VSARQWQEKKGMHEYCKPDVEIVTKMADRSKLTGIGMPAE
jgi:hypothetical protein